MKNLKENVLKTVAIKPVMAIANLNLNSCCTFWYHQPKVPKELLK